MNQELKDKIEELSLLLKKNVRFEHYYHIEHASSSYPSIIERFEIRVDSFPTVVRPTIKQVLALTIDDFIIKDEV